MYEFYNQLPDVETADALLKRHGHVLAYLEAFSRLATQAGVAEIIGTRLLHRHHAIGPDTAIIERCRVIDGERVLRSSVEPIPLAPVHPSSWAWTADGLMGLEFSEDSAVRDAQERCKSFAKAWTSLIEHAQLAELLGLTLIARDHLQAGSSQVFVETSDALASTVRLRPLAEAQASDIVTVWIARPLAACTPGNYCRQWSTCRREGSPPDDRHSYRFGHDQMKGPHVRATAGAVR